MNAKRSFVASLAVLAIGLAGLIGGSAATVHAAGSAASPFELTLEVEERFTGYGLPGEPVERQGTFRSEAPFCATGTFVDLGTDRTHATWRFTCDDGTGSLTVSIAGPYPGAARWNSTWHILDGSGSYAGLRGRGSLQGEVLGGEFSDSEAVRTWRSTFEGVVDRDAVAPTIAFSSATATKLRRPTSAYALKLGLSLRDDVTDNPVSYTVRACAYTVDACAGRVELARRFGTARTGTVSIKLRIRPPAGLRTVKLQLTAEDPVGNAVSVRRALGLPR